MSNEAKYKWTCSDCGHEFDGKRDCPSCGGIDRYSNKEYDASILADAKRLATPLPNDLEQAAEERAEEIVNVNLGYYAGYYGHETRLRVERLFNTQHPYFGKAENGFPTSKEAFEIGIKIAGRITAESQK